MRFKGTLILLILCLALGGYLYFYEIKGGEQREKAREAEKQVWKLEQKDINRIEILSGGEHTVAVRETDQWTITAPRKLEADADELNRLANSAANILREAVVEAQATDLSKFGLDPAQSSLKVTTKGGKEYGISFGHNNPTGSSSYAVKQGTNEVFLVSSAVVSAFAKRTNELRNQRVLSFEQPEVQSLSLKSSAGDLDLTKDNDDLWWLTGSEKIAADSPGVRGILNALSMARIKEFFDPPAAEQVQTGFDTPLVDVKLTIGRDRAVKRLVIGRSKPSLDESSGTGEISQVYLARDEARPDLFFVEKDLVDKLMKSHRDMRDKALASFQRWNIDFIALTNTKGSFSFTKSAGEWFISGTKKKADWEAINGILDTLEKPVKDWIDSPARLSVFGLEKPLMRVILKQGSSVRADCSFGGAAKNGGIYALVKGMSSVKIADSEGMGILDKAAPDYVESAKGPE